MDERVSDVTVLRRMIQSIDNGAWGDEPTINDQGIKCVRAADFDFAALKVRLDKAPLRSINASARSRLMLNSGDLVLEKSGGGERQAVGRAVMYVDQAPAVCSNFAARLRPTGEVDSRYLCYLLAALYYDGATARCILQTTGIQNLDTDAWLETEVPTVPLAEQRRIADFLDDQVARIDNIIAARASQVQLLTERRDSQLGHVMSVVNEALPMRRVVDQWIDYRGATPLKTSSGVRLITAKNIRDGRIELDASKEWIAEVDYKRWMVRGLPMVGDVLLTTEAPLGQVAQVDDAGIALAQRVILIRSKVATMSPRWLYWYLRSPAAKRELNIRATGSTAPGIKAERLREVPITVPTLREQGRLLVEIETVESAWRSSRALIAASIGRLHELKRSLITAAVTGEFDVSTTGGSKVPIG